MPAWRCLNPDCPDDMGWRHTTTDADMESAARAHAAATHHGVAIDYEREG